MTQKQQDLMNLVSNLTVAVRTHTCTVAAKAYSPGIFTTGEIEEARKILEDSKKKLQEFVEREVV